MPATRERMLPLRQPTRRPGEDCRRSGGAETLARRTSSVWRALEETGAATCLVCGGEMSAAPSGCASCGARLE
ncbi:MAG: hypothetical protein H0W09_05250 [Solirubrobacterales bacterium]|nr:hypothetical protein [Solirubrobacterales bacterium]